MRFSFSSLKECINLKPEITTLDICDALNDIGLEVEGISNPANLYKNFIIANVISTEKHPESDKLNLCKVDTGNEIIDVVCGASNVRGNLKVVLAKVGSIVPSSGIELKKTSIRGRESNGMICSASELNLKEEGGASGILELPSSAVVGTPFADFLGKNDDIIEIAITPNRGDACSVLGIARDLAAKKLGDFIEPQTIQNITFNENLKVIIEDDLLKAFTNIHFVKANFKNFTDEALKSLTKYKNIWGTCGTLKADLLNYTMFLFGAPMHIYDYSKIQGNIRIRRSNEGEVFIPIKGEEIKLANGLLVACDDVKVLSLIGVMGDARSKVSDATTDIVVEALHIIPEEVILSSRITNIKSDSAYRFARGVDSKMQKAALNIVLSKLSITNTESFTLYNNEEVKSISLPLSYYEKITGLEPNEEEIKGILLSLGYKVKSQSSGEITLEVPTFKNSINLKEDLISEIIRIKGYSCVKPLEIKRLKPVIDEDINFATKRLLSEEMQEIITYSFFKTEYFGMFANHNKIELLNPITQDLAVMRDSLIPNLLENICEAESKSYGSSQIFEIGTIFEGTSQEKQKTNICGLFSGFSKEKSFLQKEERFTIWHAKNKMLEVLVKVYGISQNSISFKNFVSPNFHPRQSFELFIGKNKIGILGSIHPVVLDKFNIINNVFAFELYTKTLTIVKKQRIYKEQILPDVIREISIIISKEIKFEEIAKRIKSLKIVKIKNISALDVFEDENRIGEGLKSISLQFTIKQESETLTKEEIDKEIILLISSTLEKEYNAKLRDGNSAK